jgi:hypothetical protein
MKDVFDTQSQRVEQAADQLKDANNQTRQAQCGAEVSQVKQSGTFVVV